MLVSVDRHNIETHYVVCESRVPCDEQCCSPDNFALLVNIDGQARSRETIAAAKADFDEDEAIVILHYQGIAR